MEYDLLNKLTVRDDKGYQYILGCFQERYGNDVIAFLTTDEESIEAIIDSFTGGDSFYEEVCNYFAKATWYPLVYGVNLSNALDNLEDNLQSTFKAYLIPESVNNTKSFHNAVERASKDFTCKKHKSILKPLPDSITEYMHNW